MTADNLHSVTRSELRYGHSVPPTPLCSASCVWSGYATWPTHSVWENIRPLTREKKIYCFDTTICRYIYKYRDTSKFSPLQNTTDCFSEFARARTHTVISSRDARAIMNLLIIRWIAEKIIRHSGCENDFFCVWFLLLFQSMRNIEG